MNIAMCVDMNVCVCESKKFIIILKCQLRSVIFLLFLSFCAWVFAYCCCCFSCFFKFILCLRLLPFWVYFIAMCGYSDNLNIRSFEYHDGARTKNDRMKEIDNAAV